MFTRIQTLLPFVAIVNLAIVCAGCDSGSTDPADGSTGVMYGTVIVYDANLKPLTDRSGVIVRYVDTDGKVFEAVSNKDGVWEIKAPFGVYIQDTIMKSGLIQMHPGWSSVAGTKQQVDWLGKGRREIMRGTMLCPPELDEVVTLRINSAKLDSIYTPADSSRGPGHSTSESYKLQLKVDALLDNHGYGSRGSMTTVMVLPDGTRFPMQPTDHTGPIIIRTEAYEVPWDSWKGARMEWTVTQEIEQTFPVRRPDGDWTWERRLIPSKPSSLNVQVIP
jgi:hypothetical protein